MSGNNTSNTSFIMNPKPFLIDLIGHDVRVRLKWGMEYIGILESADAYMNIQLSKTKEYVSIKPPPIKNNNNNNHNEDTTTTIDDNKKDNNNTTTKQQQQHNKKPQFAGYLGDVLIRCNNVLYIQAIPIEGENDDDDDNGNDDAMDEDKKDNINNKNDGDSSQQ